MVNKALEICRREYRRTAKPNKRHIEGFYLTSLAGQASAPAEPGRLRPAVGEGILPEGPGFARGWRALASTSDQRGSFMTDRQRSQLLSSCVDSACDAPTSLRNAIAAREPGGPRSPPAGEVPCAPSPGARRWPAPRRGTPDTHLPAPSLPRLLSHVHLRCRRGPILSTSSRGRPLIKRYLSLRALKSLGGQRTAMELFAQVAMTLTMQNYTLFWPN